MRASPPFAAATRACLAAPGALITTACTLLAGQQTVERARRAYRVAQPLMRAGTITFTLLNSETTLLTAENALAQAKYAPLQSLVSLYQALSGGWQQQDEGL